MDQLHRNMVYPSLCRDPWKVKVDAAVRQPLVIKLQESGLDGWFEPFNNDLHQMEICMFSYRHDQMSAAVAYNDSMTDQYPTSNLQITALQPKNIMSGTQASEVHVKQAQCIMKMYHEHDLSTCLDDYIQRLYEELQL